jgi:hypothetical protein
MSLSNNMVQQQATMSTMSDAMHTKHQSSDRSRNGLNRCIQSLKSYNNNDDDGENGCGSTLQSQKSSEMN